MGNSMKYLSPQAYDNQTKVKIIALIDLLHSLGIMSYHGLAVVIRTPKDDKESTLLRRNQSNVLDIKNIDWSTTTVVIIFILVVCFFALHFTMALKLYISLLKANVDALLSTRQAKAWQNWSIFFLIVIVANLFATILSSETKLQVFINTIISGVEIAWRLFGIYNVGLFINDLVVQIPSTIPTLQFFAVRFPIPQGYNIEDCTKKNSSSC